MAEYKLKALGMRYHDDKRVREGQIFFMDEKFVKLDKNGKMLSPKNCELLEAPKAQAVNKNVQRPVKPPVKVQEIENDSDEVI